jgi:cytochrome c biogenesis protein CcmG/thiol:disulfide interchange protein DsbE
MRISRITFCVVIFLFLIGELAAGKNDLKGKVAPDFTVQKLGAQDSVSLSALRGKVVLLDFWASECEPCKKSLPYLAKLDAKYKNLVVIAVNTDDDKESALQFLTQFELQINAVYDKDKKVKARYDVSEMPSAYLVDQYGKIQYIYDGYTEKSMKKLEFTVRGLVDQF